MCINSFDILFPQSISFQNIECLCTIRRAGNYLETWPLGENARSCCSHMPQSSTSFCFLQNFLSLISILACGSEKQLQLPLLVSLHPCNTSPGCISVVSRGMGVMKHSPVDTHGSVEHEFQLHWTEFQSSRAASQPARNNQHPNLPNCPRCVNDPSTPVTPEIGNTVLRKAGSWEACRAVCPLPQSCNTATGQQDEGKYRLNDYSRISSLNFNSTLDTFSILKELLIMIYRNIEFSDSFLEACQDDFKQIRMISTHLCPSNLSPFGKLS